MGQPGDFGGDVFTVCEGGGEALPDVRGAADAGEEGGLEKAWNAEGGGDEDDAEGGVGAEEEILGRVLG